MRANLHIPLHNCAHLLPPSINTYMTAKAYYVPNILYTLFNTQNNFVNILSPILKIRKRPKRGEVIYPVSQRYGIKKLEFSSFIQKSTCFAIP